MRKLLRTGPLLAARARLVRLLAALVALAIAVHALARVLLSSHLGSSEWAYLAISLAIAAAVWLTLSRAAPPRR